MKKGRLSLDKRHFFGIINFAFKSLYAGVAHLAERHLAKVEVASSNLVARSRIKPRSL